jgi:hypothetical protein
MKESQYRTLQLGVGMVFAQGLAESLNLLESVGFIVAYFAATDIYRFILKNIEENNYE